MKKLKLYTFQAKVRKNLTKIFVTVIIAVLTHISVMYVEFAGIKQAQDSYIKETYIVDLRYRVDTIYLKDTMYLKDSMYLKDTMDLKDTMNFKIYKL